MSLHLLGIKFLALVRFGINFGDGVDQLDDVEASALGIAHIGNEGKDVSCLDGAVSGTLVTHSPSALFST